jgi:predicted ester cyclase
MASTAEANKALIKRYAEHGIPRLMKGDREAMHEFMHEHYVLHTPPHHDDDATDRAGATEGMAQASAALAGASFKIDTMIAEGDLVVAHWHLQGKHTGRHQHRHVDGHVEGSGADASIRGLSLYRIEDGKIAEQWRYDNHLDFFISSSAIKVTA